MHAFHPLLSFAVAVVTGSLAKCDFRQTLKQKQAHTFLVCLGAVELLLELAGEGAHEIVHVTHAVDEEDESAGRHLCRRGFEAREISGKKRIG